MQIYLLKDLPGKGKAGEIINVNDGYGKNYIIKNKIGKPADNAVLTQVKAKQESNAFHTAEEIKAIKELCKKLEGITITIKAKIGANGKMFGSVTSNEISAELSLKGIDIDKKNINLPEPIKTVGSYKIKTKFPHGLEGLFNVIVEA